MKLVWFPVVGFGLGCALAWACGYGHTGYTAGLMLGSVIVAIVATFEKKPKKGA